MLPFHNTNTSGSRRRVNVTSETVPRLFWLFLAAQQSDLGGPCDFRKKLTRSCRKTARNESWSQQRFKTALRLGLCLVCAKDRHGVSPRIEAPPRTVRSPTLLRTILSCDVTDWDTLSAVTLSQAFVVDVSKSNTVLRGMHSDDGRRIL